MKPRVVPINQHQIHRYLDLKKRDIVLPLSYSFFYVPKNNVEFKWVSQNCCARFHNVNNPLTTKLERKRTCRLYTWSALD